METTQRVESSTNSTSNPTSPQLENTNETTTNNEELQDFQRVYSCRKYHRIENCKSFFLIFDSAIPNFVQPIDNSPPVITPVPSGESVPVQLLLDPTTVGQESTTSIEVLIQDDGVVTISKDSSAKTFVKRSKGISIFHLSIDHISLTLEQKEKQCDIHFNVQKKQNQRMS